MYQVLKDWGHDCCIGYGRGVAPEGIKSYRIGSDMDVYLHVLYSRITDRTGFASSKATKLLINQIRQYKPDIIHLHNLHGYYVNIDLLFNFFGTIKTPIVWSLYDCWSMTGHCCHFDYIGCDKWKTGCHHCDQKKEYPTTYLLDQSHKNYITKQSLFKGCKQITMVAPSKWLRDIIKESYLHQFPSAIIPSGIDLNQFKPTSGEFRQRYHLEDKYIVLGVSFGFSKLKGSEYFIQLSERLSKEYQVVLIGVDEKQRGYFPSTILTLPRTKNIKNLAEYYTVADVFVNPTLQESQGLTNIEALACGTGVVTFDSGGSPEGIDESCGYVVKRGDGDGFINAVVKACIHPFDQKACINRAGLFDKAKLYQDYIKLYEALRVMG